jgi:hypothetical protein
MNAKAVDQVSLNELVRRVDGLVERTSTDITWGKALYGQFKEHCTDDESRHKENVERLTGIEAQGARTTAAIEAQAAEVKKLTDALNAMTPTFRRLRAKQATRRAVIQCLSRWRGILVGLGVSAGGAYVWLDGHWPKIAALIRKVVGP